MAVDEVDGDEMHDEDPVCGPQTLDQRNLNDIHRMRRDALNELYGRLDQAHQDGAFERIERTEAQIDGWTNCI